MLSWSGVSWAGEEEGVAGCGREREDGSVLGSGMRGEGVCIEEGSVACRELGNRGARCSKVVSR